MSLGHQRQVRPADQVFLPVAPTLDLAVHIGEPLVQVERVDDVVGVLKQVLEIGLRLFDFPGPLLDLQFQRLAILLELPLQDLAFRDVAQLHHDVGHGAGSDAGEVQFHGNRPPSPIEHLDFYRRRLVRPLEDLLHQPRDRRLVLGQDEVGEATAHELLFRILEDGFLAPVDRDDASAGIHHDHRIGGLVEQDLVALLRFAEVPRPARHLVFKPFRMLAEAGRHLVEAVGQLFDLIAGHDIEPVVEFAPTDQGRSLLQHLDRAHDPAGQEAASHEHEDEHPDGSRGDLPDKLVQRRERLFRVLPDEGDPLHSVPAQALTGEGDRKPDRRIPDDRVPSPMRVIFGYHPASRRLCDLPHQGGVDGMLVGGEHRADQRPTGRTQEHRVPLFADPDLLDRLEEFIATQADVDCADRHLLRVV